MMDPMSGFFAAFFLLFFLEDVALVAEFDDTDKGDDASVASTSNGGASVVELSRISSGSILIVSLLRSFSDFVFEDVTSIAMMLTSRRLLHMIEEDAKGGGEEDDDDDDGR